MKVIIAGYSKTGTKSIQKALRLLGYSVDDLHEHLDERTDYWWRIFVADPNDPIAQTPEIFKEMYANVDACTDTPAYLFWEQILEAFPNAKVILSERDNEDVWWDSLRKHFIRERRENIGAWLLLYFPNWILKLCCDDMWRAHRRHRDMSWGGAVGPLSPIGPNRVNAMIAKKRYREHNAYVREKCPSEKLLIYNAKQGWDPLVKFLGIKAPDIPFPNANKGGQIISDVLKRHPRALRQRSQLIRNFLILCIAATSVIIYLLKCITFSF